MMSQLTTTLTRAGTLLLVAMMAGLVLGSGVALAALVEGNNNDNTLSSGVMLRLAGILVFAPDGSVTHHGAGEFAIDEEDNLVIPASADAALCAALDPQ